MRGELASDDPADYDRYQHQERPQARLGYGAWTIKVTSRPPGMQFLGGRTWRPTNLAPIPESLTPCSNWRKFECIGL